MGLTTELFSLTHLSPIFKMSRKLIMATILFGFMMATSTAVIPDPLNLFGKPKSTEEKIKEAIVEGTQELAENSQRAFEAAREALSNIDLNEVHESTSAAIKKSVEAINIKVAENHQQAKEMHESTSTAIAEGTQQLAENSQQAFETVKEAFANIDLNEVHESTTAAFQQSVETINNKFAEVGGPELVEQAS